MEYHVTHFTITAAPDLLQTSRELLADALGEAGYESFEDTPAGLNAYIQTQLYAPAAVEQTLADFPIEGVGIEFTSEEVAPQDWNAEFEKQVFAPIRVGGDCIIYDAASPDAAILAVEAPLAIAIDQRMAFGNGAHETTNMIVAELLRQPVAGRRVLDCGCGTGILSLVAARLGAEHVTAYDIDEWSVENTRHNAELGGISLPDVLLGDVSVLSHVDGVFDIIVANINRNILLADMEAITATLAPGGTLILSGFYEQDAPLLLEKAATLGLAEEKRTVENDWTMLVLKGK